MKNVNRRAKNLKTVLGQERERERAERESRRLAREELMKTDPEAARRIPDEAPSCEIIVPFVAGKAVNSNDTSSPQTQR